VNMELEELMRMFPKVTEEMEKRMAAVQRVPEPIRPWYRLMNKAIQDRLDCAKADSELVEYMLQLCRRVEGGLAQIDTFEARLRTLEEK
jgi:hypothetical protein